MPDGLKATAPTSTPMGPPLTDGDGAPEYSMTRLPLTESLQLGNALASGR